MRNKIFTRIIITTLLCAFLTFSVGKVTRVSAVGTTAAIAGTAFILTGAVYLSYIALTQGEMVLPAAEEMHNWLGGMGRKVSQYPSGAEAYQDIYQGLLRDPTAHVIDGVWTWTQDRLKAFANDFSDTRINQNIAGYIALNDTNLMSWNGFTYPFEMQMVPELIKVYFNEIETFEYLIRHGYQVAYPEGDLLCLYDLATPSNSRFAFTDGTKTLRNKLQNGEYTLQELRNGTWTSCTAVNIGVLYDNGLTGVNGSFDMYNIYVSPSYGVSRALPVPYLPHCDIYDVDNDVVITAVEPVTTDFKAPKWVDPDNENRPIIPWVPIPQLPTNVTPPSGFVNPQWGFNLQDILDKLEDLAGQLIDIGGIAGLINEFAGLHGDEYYIEYNDGDTNYYTYYQPTIYDNDTQYITYNYDITDEQDKIPIDLNTIQLYTNNRYLAQIKESAVNGSTMLRDLAVFWHDVDPEITYIVFGCCILILIGAFTGKLGHS